MTDSQIKERIAILAKLVEEGRLSAGRAARLAGMNRIAFLGELQSLGIAAINLSDEEVEAEIRAARELAPSDMPTEEEIQGGRPKMYRASRSVGRDIISAMETLTYTVQLEPAEEGGYVVTVPSLPGCVTQGETYEEALAMAEECIRGFLEALIKAGQPVPREAERPRVIEARIQVEVPAA